MTIAAEGPNAAQIAYWNAEAGQTWTEMQDLLDRELEPLGRAAMAALGPRPGETILDIGCGSGGPALELARQVGPEGQVLAVDISAPQLALAERRAAAAGLGDRVSFRLADAQTEAFDAPADALFSRFGVMFFTDPPAAFANLHGALKPGGRLAFVCWRSAFESPCMSLPMMAAAAAAPELAPPPAADPHAPGPFAFADAERVRGILGGAGFSDIAIQPFDAPISVGDLEATLGFSLRVGMLGGRLREAPHLRETVVAAVREALARHVENGDVWLGAAVWIVTATA